jgi:hypothetical protein
MAHAKSRAAWAEVARKPKDELLVAAAAALDVLDVKDFQELKSLAKPPAAVAKVFVPLLHLLAGFHPAIELTGKGSVKQTSWKAVQSLLANPRDFLQTLMSFKDLIDAGRVPRRNVGRARRLIDEMGDEFSVHAVAQSSGAAAGICAWVINIIAYYDLAAPPAPRPSVDARLPNSEPASNGMQKSSGLDTLQKSSIVELKCLANPPEGVKAICCACYVLLHGTEQEIDWKNCRDNMLSKMDFPSALLAFDPQTIPEKTLDKVEALMEQSFPDPEAMLKQSAAAADLARWVVGVVQLRRAASRGGA